jgi:large conductance mechanosensitive channel
MLKEFKTFIMRGNVIDLAVAVIIGGAFSAIVGSLITDIITPLLLQPAMSALGVTELEKIAWNGVKYGKFIAAVINFLVTAFIIFMMIKAMNKIMKKKEEEPAPSAPLAPTKDQELLAEIRDLLKK